MGHAKLSSCTVPATITVVRRTLPALFYTHLCTLQQQLAHESNITAHGCNLQAAARAAAMKERIVAVAVVFPREKQQCHIWEERQSKGEH